MEEKEIIKSIKEKLKDTENLRNLTNKDLKFKSWYASTIMLLKSLPSNYSKEVRKFKKLTFADTKFHREKMPYNPGDESKYNQDLSQAEKILEKITSTKKASNNK